MPSHGRHSKNPSSPIPRGSCTCGSLRKASRRISQLYDAALSPVGIKSTQFSILAELDRASVEGPVMMCELATAMVMDRSTLGHNLKPLQRDDLVLLRLSSDDRRKRYVELTKKGKSVLRRSRRLWTHAEGRFEKIFGKKAAAELRTVLLNIAANEELNSPIDRPPPARNARRRATSLSNTRPRPSQRVDLG